MEQRRLSIKRVLYHFFIAQKPLQQRLQLLSQIIQSFVYVAIINGIHFSEFLNIFSQSQAVFSALLVLCLLKTTFMVVLRFGISLIALQLIITKPDRWLIPNCFLLAYISIFQVLTLIDFNFSSSSVQMESRVGNKVIRMILLLGNIIIINLVKTPTYIHLSSALLSLILLWSKQRSLMKSEEYKAIALRFYLYAACEHLRLFLTAFLPTANTLPAAVLSFLLSQSFFALLVYCRPTPNCHQLLAKRQYLHLAFVVLRYVHSTTYDQNIQEFVQSFIGDYVQEQTRQLKSSDGRQSTTEVSKRAVYCFVLGLLSKSDGFLQTLLGTELHSQSGRVVLALENLRKARMKLSWYDLLQSVMLLHAQRRIATHFTFASSKVAILYEQAERSFLNFQDLIYKAALQHLRFNLYLKRKQMELNQIKKNCLKIINLDNKIVQQFKRVRKGFISNGSRFIGYLIRVKGDYFSASRFLNDQIQMETSLLRANLQKKLFVSITLSVDGLVIDQVGFNAYQLLGFNPNELKGQTVQRLVPSFFRNQHNRISNAFVHGSSQQTLLFQRQTIVLKKQGGYSLCEIVLRMGMGEKGFFYNGYLRFMESEHHDLNSFFYASAEGVLLQWSEELLEEEETERSVIKVQYLFEDVLGKPLVRTVNKTTQIFDPILHYNGESPFYFYARRVKGVQKIKNYSSKQECPSKLKNLPTFYETSPFSMQKSEEAIQIENQVENKEIIILLAFVAFFLLGLFSSEYLMIVSATVKYNNQNFAINNFINLIQYYENSMKLSIDLTYLDFKDNYNYSNTFSATDTDKAALKLHTLNERLKVFNLGKYNLPTFNNDISYQESSYEIVLMLVADARIYSTFSTDSFLKSATLSQVRRVIPVFAMQSSTDYRIAIFNLMKTFVQDDIYYENLSFWVSTANILAFVFFGARIFWKLKSMEDYALRHSCVGSFKQDKIKNILEFLKEITNQQNSFGVMSKQMQVYELPDKTQTNNTLISEASLVRESSRRNFSLALERTMILENDIQIQTLNNMNFMECMDKAETNEGSKRNSRYIFIKTDSYRYVLLAFVLFVSVLTTLNSINEIVNNKNKNLDEVASLNSVLTLYRSITYYSARGVIVTFNAMIQKNENGVDTSAAYLSAIKILYNYLSTFQQPIFPEVKFSEFSKFSSTLTNLYQEPICNYIDCDAEFRDQVNLNFISVIKKYSLNLTGIFQTTINYSQSQMAAYLTDNRRYIDLLFYTQMTLREYISSLVMDYLDSYTVFIQNLYSSKLNYITYMIVITVIGLLFFLLLVYQVRKQQKLMIKINKIYGEPIGE